MARPHPQAGLPHAGRDLWDTKKAVTSHRTATERPPSARRDPRLSAQDF